MTISKSSSLSPEKLAKIEQDFDPETSFRQFDPILTAIVTFFLVTMSIYHFYASGFGLVRELVHRGIHISFVLKSHSPGLVEWKFSACFEQPCSNANNRVSNEFIGAPNYD